MFAADQQLTVTLRADQWNQVLALLSDGPYRVVNPLIQEMTQQLNNQEGMGAQERVVPFRPQEAPPPSPQPESA